MKHKTAELQGDALDYMVRCAVQGEQPFCSVAEWAASNDGGWHPSTNWEQGGPIIEREEIDVSRNEYPRWSACLPLTEWTDMVGFGPTPLVAAMRAFVLAKLGGQVELP